MINVILSINGDKKKYPFYTLCLFKSGTVTTLKRMGYENRIFEIFETRTEPKSLYIKN